MDAVDARVKIEKQLEEVKSEARRGAGPLEAKLMEELKEASKAEEEARRKLDDVIYDALGLNNKERKQVEEGLKELRELRRMRTQA
ncbi:MAG: hypothetical protein QW385_08385 [Thermoproteota archaeon]